jgi:hypothetical protein
MVTILPSESRKDGKHPKIVHCLSTGTGLLIPVVFGDTVSAPAALDDSPGLTVGAT